MSVLKKNIRLKIFGRDRFVPLYMILTAISLVVIVLFIRYIFLQDKWHTLNVEWHGYSIDYPALWSTQTYAASGGRGANLDHLSGRIMSFGLLIAIHQTEMKNTDLTDAFDWWQETMMGWRLTNFSPPVETQIGYDTYPAIMQSYYDGGNLVHAYFVISDNRAYLIEFKRVSEDSQPIIDQMLASFRLYKVGDE